MLLEEVGVATPTVESFPPRSGSEDDMAVNDLKSTTEESCTTCEADAPSVVVRDTVPTAASIVKLVGVNELSLTRTTSSLAASTFLLKTIELKHTGESSAPSRHTTPSHCPIVVQCSSSASLS